MRMVYVRELKPYSLKELSDAVFAASESYSESLLKDLMARGIARYRTGNTDLGEYSGDDEPARPDQVYQFRFVGLVMFRGYVIVSYPKYFRDREPSNDELKLIMRVLKKNNGFADISSLEDGAERLDDTLPVMLALLEMYDEHGEYSNYIEDREQNGNGPIDWNRTIDRHLPVLVEGRPVYLEMETRKTLRDESDFITRLHRAALSEISLRLHEAGVDELLSIDEVYLSDEEVEEFGGLEALEWRLNRERSSQFVDWKLMTLDLLERYLLGKESFACHNEIHTLGTTSFYHVWELACATAFGNMLDNRLDGLGIELRGKWIERKQDKLIEIIPRPKWERATREGYAPCGDVATLIPDTVSIAVDDRGRKVFCIYDAKYYVPTTSGAMKYQPGLESVTKQFLYQSAYKGFVLDHGFDYVTNAFLVPGNVDKPKLMARVSFPGVIAREEHPLSNFIAMWTLPASEVFETYLRGELLSGSTLLMVGGAD